MFAGAAFQKIEVVRLSLYSAASGQERGPKTEAVASPR